LNTILGLSGSGKGGEIAWAEFEKPDGTKISYWYYKKDSELVIEKLNKSKI
jgi:hypothetical protein